MPAVQKRTLLRRFVQWSAVRMLTAVGSVVLLCGLLWVDHRRETTLPSPSGPFAVGRTLLAWNVSPSHSAIRGAERPSTLLAWIWYPADSPTQPQAMAKYLPDSWRSAVERHAGFLLSKVLTRDLSLVRTHSFLDAELSSRERSYPVVLLRAGLAARTAAYTSLAEDLASHGYVVVGFDVPYRTMVVVLPDGTVVERTPENDADHYTGREQAQVAMRLVTAWSADLSSAVDQLERLNASDPTRRLQGRLDLQRIGIVGHSLGGATALQFCHDDARCKAGIDLDGAPMGNLVSEGVRQPFMFLLGDHTGEPDAPEIQARIRAIYDRLPADQRLLLTIRGANHFGFSDDGAFLKSPLAMKLLRVTKIVRLDGRRQMAITTHYIDAFFDVYLKGAPNSQLTGGQLFPEVVGRQ